MLVSKILSSQLAKRGTTITQALWITHSQIQQFAFFKQHQETAKRKNVMGRPIERSKISQTEQNYTEIVRKIITAKSLSQLEPLQTAIFHEDRNNLPIYLKKIATFMNKETYPTNRIFFQHIHEKLNKSSSELLLRPNQLLEILFFHYNFKQLDQRQLPNIINGFQHRATMIAATFMLNQELNITEAIALIDLLTRLGAASLLLNINFIKFLKIECHKTDSLKNIDIVHLVTILNLNFLKDNHTVLENILFDTTLNYLLSNYEHLLIGSSLQMKYEILKILLCLDLRLYYLSSHSICSNLIKILLKSVQSSLGGQWVKNISDTKAKASQNQLNLHQVVNFVECCDYAVTNRLINHVITNQIVSILQTITSLLLNFLSRGEQLNSSFNADVAIRILFNPQIFSIWKEDHFKDNERIQKIILLSVEKNVQFLLPIIDLMEDQAVNSEDKLKFINLFSKINNQLMKKNKINWAIASFIIERADSENSIILLQTIQEKMKQLSLDDRLCFIILLSYVKHHAQNSEKKEHLQAVLNTHTSQLHKDSSDKFQMIKQINKAFNQLRNTRISQFSMIIWSKLSLFNSPIVYPNKIIRDQTQLSLLKLLFMGICSQDAKIAQYFLNVYNKLKFSEHVIYAHLMMFPIHYPEPKYYRKQEKSILSLHFKSTMTIIMKLYKLDKYYYLIWELFMKNYQLQSRQVKQQCFELLQQVFMRAYRREKQRKVVLLSNLTSYMSEGTISATQNQLTNLFNLALEEILLVDDGQFHYYCFMSIIFNSFSCGILSFTKFERIIQLNAKCSENLNITSNILMLFGCLAQINKKTSPFIGSSVIEQQTRYVRSLLKNKNIRIMDVDINKDSEKSAFMGKKKLVEANVKLIAVLIMFRQPYIANYQQQIVRYIQNCYDFADFMIITEAIMNLTSEGNSYKFNSQATKLVILKRLALFKNQELLSESRFTQIQQKLSDNS